MKDSEVLIKAKELIANKKQEFICHAIADIAGPTSKQAESLCAWILKMLGNRITYNSWLNRHYPELYDKSKDYTFKKARLQWLDWMILYCQTEESGGDTSKLLNSEG